jgi:hypothetical protein
MLEQDSSGDREKRIGEKMRHLLARGQDGRRSSGKRERERLLGQNKLSGEN